jgi:hypothetical protein
MSSVSSSFPNSTPLIEEKRSEVEEVGEQELLAIRDMFFSCRRRVARELVRF